MGLYVHINVCFACSKNDGVAAVAKRHLIDSLENQEARWFLEDLAGRTGKNPGPKGGLSTWGMVGNYTNGEEFVTELKPFWTELLRSEVDGGPLSFEHILVFVEREQSERATAFEIFLDESSEGAELLVKEHECPFAWMQF